MKPFKVWATNKSDWCMLLAHSEEDAIEHIEELRLYGDLPLNAERVSHYVELPTNLVVLHTGATEPLPGRR